MTAPGVADVKDEELADDSRFETRDASPDTLELAARELVEAELALLEAQSGVDYAESLVAYNTKRVERLRAYITTGDRKGLEVRG